MLTGRSFTTLVLIGLSLAAVSCSVPNLETAECAAARNSVKRFYSLHFANQVNPSDEYLKTRDGFLTEQLKNSLALVEEDEDYFTKTRDFPKAFRVGACSSNSENRARLEVVLLWRDDVRNEQAEVQVNAIRSGGEWVIDSVEN